MGNRVEDLPMLEVKVLAELCGGLDSQEEPTIGGDARE